MSWITTTHQPNGAGLWQQNGVDPETAAFGGTLPGMTPPPAGYGAADGYQPPWWGGSSGASSAGTSTASTNGLLGQIVSLLQQLVGSLGGSLGSAFGGGSTSPQSYGQPYGGQSYGGQSYGGQPFDAQPPGSATFSNATLSSTGDPHLALTGTEQTANGTQQINSHYDDMNAQHDLLSTNDFHDGFHVSTTATQPNANGVTYNASATATMDHGRESVTMGPGGTVTVDNFGTQSTLAAGQSITLAGGEVVSENTSGAVSIAEQNARGAALTTTFSYNGSGVDVNATASGGVTLGGSLVRHATGIG